MPIPLAIKLPGLRWLFQVDVELLDDDSLEDWLPDPVVLAVLLAGVFGMELVFPLIMSAVPLESSEYVVPEIVIASPGFSVVPGARTYSVVPSRRVGEYVLPSIVRAGAEVTPGRPRVEVTPLTTMTDPDAEAGIEIVVPDIVMMPPGVRV